jgi:uncharacterized protein YbjT (DUF2867 family)
MFAITGITGQVGGATARALLRHGKKIRAIVRDEKKGEAWKAQGAEVAIASLEDASQLERAFENVEGAFIMTPPFYHSLNPREESAMALACITHALRASHVPKVVCLSSVGAQHAEGTGAILKLHDMERALFPLSMPTASIRAAFFMENFAPLLEHARTTGKLPTMLEPLDKSIAMVATKDIGEAAAGLLVDKTWYGDQIVELEGPTTYSPNDAAKILSEVLKTPVAAEVIPRAALAGVYEQFGFSAASAASMVEMADGFKRGLIRFEGNGAVHQKGSTTLEEVFRG